jgi:excisionase family DNA binding protein
MNQATRIADDYYTPQQLARELEVGERTLARWRATRKGPPAIKVGRDVRYSRESVRKWLERLESRPQF